MRTRFEKAVPLLALCLGLLGSRAGAQGTASVCTDGTKSATAGRGACSGHGGVDTKATAAAAKAASAADQVACSDGTMSKGGKGACSRHGGIKSTATAPVATSTPRATVAPAAEPTAAKSTAAKSTAPGPAATAAPVQPKVASASKPSTKRGDDNDPTDAIAQCKDGMYSHAANHRGACSRHGGVAKFLKP